MNPLFQSLFEPRRIALIGASADTGKTTSRPQRFLRKHGYTGEILPINPSRAEVLGETRSQINPSGIVCVLKIESGSHRGRPHFHRLPLALLQANSSLSAPPSSRWSGPSIMKPVQVAHIHS